MMLPEMKTCSECNVEYAYFQPKSNWCPRCLGDEYRQRCKEIQKLKDDMALLSQQHARLVVDREHAYENYKIVSKCRLEVSNECLSLSKQLEEAKKEIIALEKQLDGN